MIPVVLDTNILVSALWTKSGNAARVLQMLAEGRIQLFYDARIITEYLIILARPKFAFYKSEIEELTEYIRNEGMIVAVHPSTIAFNDESDRKFYDVAQACSAFLITGNLKHFPRVPSIMSAASFLSLYGCEST